MTDPIAIIARSAAERLDADYGPGLPAAVDAALHARQTDRRPDQYADPVSLGSLIVAVASLAWTVYSDLRKKTPKPSAEAVARQVRVDLKNYETSGHAETNRITEIVVSEVIYTTREPP